VRRNQRPKPPYDGRSVIAGGEAGRGCEQHHYPGPFVLELRTIDASSFSRGRIHELDASRANVRQNEPVSNRASQDVRDRR
jgi:hypothetical protein